MKDGAHVINPDENKSIKIQWISLYVNGDNVTYFDSFGVWHILKQIKKLIGNKNTTTNIYRIQANNTLTCGSFFILLVDFMPKGKNVLDYIS